MDRQQRDTIIDFLGPKLFPLGYECIEVEWESHEHTLRVFIDQPQGITMDDCLRVNDLLIEDSELDALVPGDYRLEISSPGVERPLRTQEHFQQVTGQAVKVHLRERYDNRANGIGKLLGIDSQGVVSLEMPSGVWTFPFQAIRKANLMFEW